MAAPAIVIALAWMLVGQASSQINPRFTNKELPLRTVTDKSLEGRWAVVAATITEDFQVTWAHLSVRNTGPATQTSACFYAEYFDAYGRRCLSAAFLAANPIRPGEVRSLTVSTPGLAPATEPAEVRVYAVTTGKSGLDSYIRTPPTVISSTSPAPGGLPSRLAPGNPDGPVQALAAAAVEISEEGKILNVELHTTRPVGDDQWLLGFVKSLRFSPMRRGDQAQPSTAIVLIRLVTGYKPRETVMPYIAREDKFVKDILATLPSGTVDDLPVVNELRFDPSAYWGAGASEAVPDSPWIYVSTGTDWCPETFRWVPDGTTPSRRWGPEGSKPELVIRQ